MKEEGEHEVKSIEIEKPWKPCLWVHERKLTWEALAKAMNKRGKVAMDNSETIRHNGHRVRSYARIGGGMPQNCLQTRTQDAIAKIVWQCLDTKKVDWH